MALDPVVKGDPHIQAHNDERLEINDLVELVFDGRLSEEGLATIPASIKTGTTYTLALEDAGSVVETNNASANTVTVPTNATVAFPIGSVVEVFQLGAGLTSIVAAGGVTLRAPDGLKLTKQYASASLRKRATDEWVVVGSVTP